MSRSPCNTRSLRDRVSSRRCLNLALGLLTIVGFALTSTAEEEAKPEETPKTEEQITEERIRSFPLPVGQKASGIRVPNLSETGKLVSQFIIGAAQRKTEEKVEMQSVTMESYDDNGKSEFVIDLPASVLDLRSGKVTSDDPVTIKNPKFELSGEKMEFDTKTREGRLIGKVRMVIFGLDNLAE